MTSEFILFVSFLFQESQLLELLERYCEDYICSSSRSSDQHCVSVGLAVVMTLPTIGIRVSVGSALQYSGLKAVCHPLSLRLLIARRF